MYPTTKKAFSSDRKKQPTPDISCAPDNNFGVTLREIRLERRLSQEEAAALLGVTQSQWSAYEVGKSTPTIVTMIEMAKVLEVSPFELLGRAMDKAKYFDSTIELSSKDFEEIAIQSIEEYKKRKAAAKIKSLC